jgi:transcriptional regulator GlxA family with amidase domain
LGLPVFPQFHLEDRDLFQSFLHLHYQLESRTTLRLELDAMLTEFLAQLIRRHGQKSFSPYAYRRENKAILRAREYLEAHYTQNVSLDELSQVAALSAFHLNRIFRRDIGVPPHVYLQQLRIRHAKYLLTLKMPLAEVAVDTGFFDQAHFQRQFKRFVGVTPGNYAHASQ